VIGLASPWGEGYVGQEQDEGDGGKQATIGMRSWGEGYVGQEQDEGDASVPSPLNPTPAPTVFKKPTGERPCHPERSEG
jgi:hypothetical protein